MYIINTNRIIVNRRAAGVKIAGQVLIIRYCRSASVSCIVWEIKSFRGSSLTKYQNYLHEQMQKNAVPDNNPSTAVLFSKIVVFILAASHGKNRLSDKI